jgi:hypothetical protein
MSEEKDDRKKEIDVLAWAARVPARFIGTAHGLIHDSRPRSNMTFPKLRKPRVG